MGIFDKYENCYNYNLKIGMIGKDEECQGEFDHPGKVYKKCLRCPYFVKETAKELLIIKRRGKDGLHN